MAAALAFLHKCFVSGALAKGWGGPVCRAALDFQTHVVESLFWLTICAVSFTAYGVRAKFRALLKAIQTDLAKSTPSASARTFEVCLAMVHFSMFLQIVYYKVNILSLINMIQPCHLILLLQGIALYSRGSLGVLISLFILPALTGTLLAMVFPDTGGLDQYLELDSYWVHHYLIQAVPLYLLVRNNFLACRHASLFSLFCGLWILVLLHFSLYEIVDLSLDVNVEFMLCPTSAMVYLFSLVPPWVIWPSWRTTLALIVCVVGTLLSYMYIYAARAIQLLVSTAPAKKFI